MSGVVDPVISVVSDVAAPVTSVVSGSAGTPSRACCPAWLLAWWPRCRAWCLVRRPRWPVLVCRVPWDRLGLLA